MKSFLEYRKTIRQPEQIDEELLPREESDADRMRGSGHSHYREQFLRKNPKAFDAFAKNNTGGIDSAHVRVPVTLSESSSSPHAGVTAFLHSNNYKVTPESYKAGLATQTTRVGNPDKGIPYKEKQVSHKIGGLLEKHGASEETKTNFINDPYRTGARTSDYDIVLTGHHKDIYGGSTGRGWTSCAQMRKGVNGYDGPAAKCVQGEINNHTHMAYLVPRGGDINTQAIGRMSFKHHTGVTTGHETLLPEDRVYGTTPSGFGDAAKKVVSDLFDKKDDLYKKNSEVYNDNGKSFHLPDQLKPEHVDAAWKTIDKKNNNAKHQMYAMVNPNEKYKSTELNGVAKNIKSLHEANNTGDFPKIMDAVRNVDNNIDSKAHYHMMENKHMDDAMDVSANHFDIKNPEHVKALVNNSGKYSNHIRQVFISRVAKRIAPARTVDDYHTISSLKESGIQIGEHHKTPIAADHTMGRYPMDSIVNSLASKGEIQHTDYVKAYHSTYNMNRRSGNIYDNAVQHENAGVPGMSKVVDSLA
jgi:hypothetical protein